MLYGHTTCIDTHAEGSFCTGNQPLHKASVDLIYGYKLPTEKDRPVVEYAWQGFRHIQRIHRNELRRNFFVETVLPQHVDPRGNKWTLAVIIDGKLLFRNGHFFTESEKRGVVPSKESASRE